MNRLIFILTIFTFSCQPTPNKEFINQRVAPPNITFDKNLEIEKILEVHQFLKDNNQNSWIAQKVSYYSKNRIAKETFNEFKESNQQGKSNSSLLYDYMDDKLVQIRTVQTENSMDSEIEQDSTKKLISYNDKGQITKEITYNFRKRVPVKTLKSSKKSTISDVNKIEFEKERTWDVIKTKYFKYDSKDRKIETFEPNDELKPFKSSSQNRYTWLYDNEDKLLEYCSFDKDELIWKEVYSYSDQNYSFKRIWYDQEGQPKHLKINESDYWPLYSFHYTLDEKGREISEVTKSEENFYSRSITEYNRDGLISKKVKFDKNNEVEVTHIYKYEIIKAANNR